MLEWNILRKALEGLGCRVQVLECNTVDEIMQKHFCSRAGRCEPVSFTRYWRGMEAILHACGVFHGPLEPGIELKVQSLRLFRDAVLDELGSGSRAPEAESYPMAELRALYERLAHLATAQPEVLSYWQEKLRVLPQDDDEEVTSDEIATALLAWLEELLKDCLGVDDIDGVSEEGSSEGDVSPAGSRPALFGFNTADFGGGVLAGTADFGSQLTSVRHGAKDRYPASLDLSGGGTFGAGFGIL
jgi:hypothetical protein